MFGNSKKKTFDSLESLDCYYHGNSFMDVVSDSTNISKKQYYSTKAMDAYRKVLHLKIDEHLKSQPIYGANLFKVPSMRFNSPFGDYLILLHGIYSQPDLIEKERFFDELFLKRTFKPLLDSLLLQTEELNQIAQYQRDKHRSII